MMPKKAFIKVDTGSSLVTHHMPRIESYSGKQGPCIWLTGCMHGDEVGGTIVIQEVFKRLRTSPLMKGRICAFPLLNPNGFELGQRRIPTSKEDLNRSFPGDRTGTLAERIAAIIFDEVLATQPNLVLDLHNDWSRSISYALVEPELGAKHAATLATAKQVAVQTGLPVVRDTQQSYEPGMLAKTFSYNLLKRGIPAVTLELGDGRIIDEISVADGVQAVWNALAAWQMVAPQDGPLSYSVPRAFKRRVLRYSDLPHASVSGIVRYNVPPGSVVKPGTVVAEVFDAFGKCTETLASKTNGIVLGHSDSAVTHPGMPLFSLAVVEEKGSH